MTETCKICGKQFEYGPSVPDWWKEGDALCKKCTEDGLLLMKHLMLGTVKMPDDA